MLLKHHDTRTSFKFSDDNSKPKDSKWFVQETKQEFNFSDGNSVPEINIFTVIIGKNGTGKSRLMKSVIEELISEAENKIKLLYSPQNIIAVSISPFDRFPLKAAHHYNYTYLGLRNLESTDLGKTYMTNIFTSLLKSFAEDKERAGKISNVLAYLGYKPSILATYNVVFSSKKIVDSLGSSDPVAAFSKYYLSEYWTSRNDKLESLLALDEPLKRREIEKILDICAKRFHYSSYRQFDLFPPESDLSASKYTFKRLSVDEFNRSNIDDLMFLADMKLIKIQNITLMRNDGRDFSISAASSGEQSVVLSILGIASQISDNSLVCIDEPEVCLHPEWQEKYLDLLINTFRSYKGCHFLIATHSPLIVSKLADENCYLMKMEDGQAIPASQVNNKSVDFQLANNFGAPGFKNEYLTRELISILTIFGETGKVDDEAKEKLKKLLPLKDELNEADPVKKLMEMSQEALKESL